MADTPRRRGPPIGETAIGLGDFFTDYRSRQRQHPSVRNVHLALYRPFILEAAALVLDGPMRQPRQGATPLLSKPGQRSAEVIPLASVARFPHRRIRTSLYDLTKRQAERNGDYGSPLTALRSNASDAEA